MEVGVPPALPFENKVSNLLHQLGSWANTCLLIADQQHKQSLIKGLRNNTMAKIKGDSITLQDIADIYQPQTIASVDLILFQKVCLR